jgi:hypothetical protein
MDTKGKKRDRMPHDAFLTLKNGLIQFENYDRHWLWNAKGMAGTSRLEPLTSIVSCDRKPKNLCNRA